MLLPGIDMCNHNDESNVEVRCNADGDAQLVHPPAFGFLTRSHSSFGHARACTSTCTHARKHISMYACMDVSVRWHGASYSPARRCCCATAS